MTSASPTLHQGRHDLLQLVALPLKSACKLFFFSEQDVNLMALGTIYGREWENAREVQSKRGEERNKNIERREIKKRPCLEAHFLTVLLSHPLLKLQRVLFGTSFQHAKARDRSH